MNWKYKKAVPYNFTVFKLNNIAQYNVTSSKKATLYNFTLSTEERSGAVSSRSSLSNSLTRLTAPRPPKLPPQTVK